MKYFRLEYFVIFCIIVYFIAKFQFLPKSTIKLKKEQIVENTLKIPIEIISHKDGVYEISSYKKEKNKKIFYSESYIVLLKKGQNYFLKYTVDLSFINKKTPYLYLLIKENITQKKIFLKKFLIKLPPISPINVFETQTTVSIPQTISKIEEKTKTELQQVKLTPKEEIPNFEISIASEMIKSEYYYNQKLNISFVINNKSLYTTLPIDIETNFKNENDVIISSKTLNLKIPPQKTKEISLDFDIKPSVIPGKYFIELVFSTPNKKIKTTTEKFSVIDTPPKITLHEKPTIKYKFTNTILAEIEDDRGVSYVKLIEVDTKKKTQKENLMTLIAGNKLLGLYSFTTQKITQKDFYTFYIQASDIAGNITSTEIIKLEITK